VKGDSSLVVLPLTRHQHSIHCVSSRVAQGASKWKWAPQTTRDTPKGLQKPSENKTELNIRHLFVFAWEALQMTKTWAVS